MVRKGDLFESEREGTETLGPVEDDEELERGVAPPATNERLKRGYGIPPRAFQREKLVEGISVTRRKYDQSGISTTLKRHTSIYATARDIRALTDENGNRLWSVRAVKDGDHEAHAHITWEGEGPRPTSAQRDELMAVWYASDQRVADPQCKCA